LGINTVNMALPGVLGYYIFGRLIRSQKTPLVAFGGFAAGAGAIVLAATMTALCVATAGSEFVAVSWIVWAGDALLAFGEGVVTAAAVLFLRRVYPQIFQATTLVKPVETC